MINLKKDRVIDLQKSEYSFFDIHSHYNLFSDETIREESIKKLTDLRGGTITIGTNYETSCKALAFSGKYKNIYASIGLHPLYIHDEVWNKELYKKLYKDTNTAIQKKIVCIGECGFDYFYTPKEEVKALQEPVFISQIELSIELGLPLMLHMRPSKKSMNAYEDALSILEYFSLLHGEKLQGNAHFFSGNKDVASRFLNIGFTLSFDGPITYTKEYDEILSFIPLDKIFAETDSPFAPPEPYRKSICHPWMVTEVYKKIAKIKNIPENECMEKITENAKKFFRIH